MTRCMCLFVLFPLLAGCATGARKRSLDNSPFLRVPYVSRIALADEGLLPQYERERPLLEDFVIAGKAGQRPQPTTAWMFWNEDHLVFAFDCTDSDIVAAPESGRKHDVDGQDRVELFLWSGSDADTYYCIEIAARGALHDYSAKFYRRFDDSWHPAGLHFRVAATRAGYRVEASLTRADIEAMGFRLQAGRRIHAGLFRADFRSNAPDDPTWICWVDARGPQPDFHVAGSFGEIELQPPLTR